MSDDVRVKLSAEGVDGILDALSKVRKAAQEAGDANAEGMDKTFHATTRAKTELIVLVHELSQGNFKRLPGSFMVLAESMGSVGHAMLGIVGGAAAAAGAIYLVAKAAMDAEHTSRQMNIAIQETGNFSGETEGRMKELAATISQTSRLTMGQANELVTAMVVSGQITSRVIEQVAALTAQYAQRTGEDIAKMTPELVKMFSDPAKGAEELRNKTHDLSVEQVEEIRRLQEQGDLMGAQQKLADALGDHLGALTTKVGAFARAWDGVKKAVSGAWEALGKTVSGDFTAQEKINNINKRLEMGVTPGAGFASMSDFEKQKLIKERDELQKQISEKNKQAADQASKADKNRTDAVAQDIIHSSSYLAKMEDLRNKIVALNKTKFADPQLEAERKDAIHSINEQIETMQKRSQRNERQDAGKDYQLRQANSKLEQQRLDNELQVLDQGLKAQESAAAASYKRGEMSLTDYYARRKKIAEDGAAQEIEIMRKKAQAADIAGNAFNPATGVQRQTAELKLQGEIQKKQAELKRELDDLEQQEQQALIDKRQKQLSLDARLATIAGDKTRAAKDQLEIAQEQLRLQLQQEGANPEQIKSSLSQSRSQGEAKIGYTDKLGDANTAYASLQTRIKEIQDEVKSGDMFPVQAEQKIMDLERERLPTLESLAAALKKVADDTKDPQLIQQAAAFGEKVQSIKASTDDAGQSMANLKKTAQDAFQGGLSTFLYDVGTGTEKIGRGFEKMAYTFVSSLAKMESEYMTKQFVKWLNGDAANGSSGILANITSAISSLFGGGGAAGGAAGAASAATKTATETANTTAVVANTAGVTTMSISMTALITALAANTAALAGSAASSSASSAGSMAAMFAATGGEIRGPGTGTSDSIPAMLSDGEFVVNAKATGRPGVLSLLHALNGTPGMAGRGVAGVQRYAEGGAVSGGGGGSSVKIINVPDSSLLADHLDSAVGEQQVLNILSRNPSRVRQAIG